MPTSGNVIYERNSKLWIAAMQKATKEMLAAGWIERSKKFSQVRLRKAMLFYREMQ